VLANVCGDRVVARRMRFQQQGERAVPEPEGRDEVDVDGTLTFDLPAVLERPAGRRAP
jgi:hypothetical protein